MIRVLEQQAVTSDKAYVEYAGLSTDSKPTTGIVTGSVFLEVNTGDAYLFDEVGATWTKAGG